MLITVTFYLHDFNFLHITWQHSCYVCSAIHFQWYANTMSPTNSAPQHATVHILCILVHCIAAKRVVYIFSSIVVCWQPIYNELAVLTQCMLMHAIMHICTTVVCLRLNGALSFFPNSGYCHFCWAACCPYKREGKQKNL